MQFEFIFRIQGSHHVHEIKGFEDVDMVDLACRPKMLIHKISSSSLFMTTLIWSSLKHWFVRLVPLPSSFPTIIWLNAYDQIAIFKLRPSITQSIKFKSF
jgi:hypothetical protein